MAGFLEKCGIKEEDREWLREKRDEWIEEIEYLTRYRLKGDGREVLVINCAYGMSRNMDFCYRNFITYHYVDDCSTIYAMPAEEFFMLFDSVKNIEDKEHTKEYEQGYKRGRDDMKKRYEHYEDKGETV